MNKTSQILMMLFTGTVCFIVFFMTGHLASLFLGIASIGMLLLIFGERIFSRIIIAIGGIGAVYFATVAFINVIRAIT